MAGDITNLDQEIKLTTDEVVDVCECSVDFLKDLTRTWKKRAPIITPTWPASGSGSRTYYSFADLMIIKIIQFARRAEIDRGWIVNFVEMNKEMRGLNPTENPFSAYYLSSDKDPTKPAPLERFFEKDSIKWSLAYRIGEKVNTRCYIKIEPREPDPHVGYEWVPFKGGLNLKQIEQLTPSERKELRNEAALQVEINLNYVHWLLKRALLRQKKI